MHTYCKRCKIHYTEEAEGVCEKCFGNLLDYEQLEREKHNKVALLPKERFLARLIDSVIFLVFVKSIISESIVLQNSLSSSSEPNSFLITLAIGTILSTAVIYLIYEAVFISFFSATIGKLILGLRVVKLDGSRLSFTDGLARFTKLWFFSLMFLHVALHAVGVWFSYRTLIKKGATLWDSGSYKVISRKEYIRI